MSIHLSVYGLVFPPCSCCPCLSDIRGLLSSWSPNVKLTMNGILTRKVVVVNCKLLNAWDKGFSVCHEHRTTKKISQCPTGVERSIVLATKLHHNRGPWRLPWKPSIYRSMVQFDKTFIQIANKLCPCNYKHIQKMVGSTNVVRSLWWGLLNGFWTIYWVLSCVCT